MSAYIPEFHSLDQMTSSYGKMVAPLRYASDRATKSFHAYRGFTNPNAAKEEVQDYHCTSGPSDAHLNNQGTKFPEYFAKVSGVKGLRPGHCIMDDYQKNFAFQVYPTSTIGLPTSSISLINPYWRKQQNKFVENCNDMYQASRVNSQSGVLPFADDNLEHIQTEALQEVYKNSVNNPMSATFALNHITNDGLAQQAAGLSNMRATAMNANLLQNYGNIPTYTAEMQNKQQDHPVMAEAAGRKPVYMPPPGGSTVDPAGNTYNGLPRDAPPGSSLFNPKTGKRAAPGHYYHPDGKVVNWKGVSARKRKYEHGEATARKVGTDIGIAAAVVGGAALIATGVGAAAGAALIGGTMLATGAEAATAGAAIAWEAGAGTATALAAAGGVAGAAVQDYGTYTDPKATQAMKTNAMIASFAAAAGAAPFAPGVARATGELVEATGNVAARGAAEAYDSAGNAMARMAARNAGYEGITDANNVANAHREAFFGGEDLMEDINAGELNDNIHGGVRTNARVINEITPEQSKYSDMMKATYMSRNEASSVADELGFKLHELSKDESLVFYNDDEAIIAFRGSQTAEDFLVTDPLIYAGYGDYAPRVIRSRALVNDVFNSLSGDELVPTHQVSVTGHSLGGYLANDVALRTGVQAPIFNPFRPWGGMEMAENTFVFRTNNDFASEGIDADVIGMVDGHQNPILAHSSHYF